MGNLKTQTRETYDELFRRAAPSLWRALYVYTGGRRELAEDAVAEAFTLAMERSDAVNDPLAWIYRTSFRIASAEMKSERRRPPELAGSGAIDDPEEVQDLLVALKMLSPNQRAAVFLHYRSDLPVKEVARILGISSPTVRVHLHRARRRLQELLTP